MIKRKNQCSLKNNIGYLIAFNLVMLILYNSLLTVELKVSITANEGCYFKKVPYNQSVAMEHTKETMKLPTFDCRPIPGDAKLFEVEYDIENEHTSVKINIEVVQGYFNSSRSIECSLQKFKKNEYASESYSILSFSSNLVFLNEIRILNSSNKHRATVSGFGFYYINCYNGQNAEVTLFDDIITILPRDMSQLPKPNIKTKSEPIYDACEVPEEKRNPKKMNVLIIQIDSMSYNHFRRMFPDTFEFLSKSLPNNRIFENFMIIGENTVPNTFAYLGNVISTSMAELNIEGENSVYSSDYSNKFPFIFKDFQKLGHVTMYNEDFQINGLFQAGGSSGLKQSPANFYNFPYWEKFRSLKMQSKFCLNGHLVSDIYMDQVKKFVEAMNLYENKERSYFSANQFAMMTHDQFEGAPEFDKSLKKQLKEFSEKGYLKETFLIVMGDHGGRPYAYGDQVMLDFAEREYPNPFLSIKVPDSMVNSSYYENFMMNSDKLVTSYDLYKTMKHLYYISKNGLQNATEKCRKIMTTSEPVIRGLRGLSLFESLPSKRSCIEALIPFEFCYCFNKIDINPNSFEIENEKTVGEMAKFLYYKVVQKTEHLRSKCQQYQFERIIHAKTFRHGGKNFYEIKISVIPGPSHFRAIVRVVDAKWYQLVYSFFIRSVRGDRKRFQLDGQIFRDNKYGNQPRCLSTDSERKATHFCYCYDQ